MAELKLRFRPELRLPRSEAQSRRKSMDTLVFRVLLLSERGGDSRFGTLPPWRELVKDELLIILSQCCFPQKLIVIPALCSLMNTTSAGENIFPVNQKVQ